MAFRKNVLGERAVGETYGSQYAWNYARFCEYITSYLDSYLYHSCNYVN